MRPFAGVPARGKPQFSDYMVGFAEPLGAFRRVYIFIRFSLNCRSPFSQVLPDFCYDMRADLLKISVKTGIPAGAAEDYAAADGAVGSYWLQVSPSFQH
jgi:hypothetical protein